MCNPAPAASLRTASAAGTAGTAGPAGTTGGAAASPGTSVLAETATTPTVAALPRTGADLSPLLATGMWSVVAGGLALTAGRRLRRG